MILLLTESFHRLKSLFRGGTGFRKTRREIDLSRMNENRVVIYIKVRVPRNTRNFLQELPTFFSTTSCHYDNSFILSAAEITTRALSL
jgi:hypothetical protein